MNRENKSNTYKEETSKFNIDATIKSHIELTEGVFSLWIEAKEIANRAKAGQFVNVYCNQDSRLLPRPISICEVHKELGMIRLVYRVVGKGTEEISRRVKGETVRILGPIGNGFQVDPSKDSSLLIAGGIGIPPMLELAKQLKGNIQIVLGYRNKEVFLAEELSKYGTVHIATEDGSVGTRGNVMTVLEDWKDSIDMIYSCGPKPMLVAVKQYGIDKAIRTQLSLEEKMACGVGACLGCVCKGKQEDASIKHKRVCKEGPVFFAEEVELS